MSNPITIENLRNAKKTLENDPNRYQGISHEAAQKLMEPFYRIAKQGKAGK